MHIKKEDYKYLTPKELKHLKKINPVEGWVNAYELFLRGEIKERKQKEIMPKTMYTIRIDTELIEKLKIKAKAENRSFNNYIETALKNHNDINLNVRSNSSAYFEFGDETYYIDNSTGEHIFDHWPTKK